MALGALDLLASVCQHRPMTSKTQNHFSLLPRSGKAEANAGKAASCPFAST